VAGSFPQLRQISWALVGVALVATGPLAAQRRGNAHIAGTVIDAGTRKPIAGAKVLLVGTPAQLFTDSLGAFHFKSIADGRYTLQVVVTGVDSSSTELSVAPRERVDVEFLIGATLANHLPEITVTANPGSMSGRADFERRMAEGNGHYLTGEFIQRRRPQDLMDLMRGVAGSRIDCSHEGARCTMRFARNPRGCSPQFFMDGMRTHQSALWMTLPTDVVGIELYTGAAQVPPEFAGAASRCGVVAIWTHNGRGSRN